MDWYIVYLLFAQPENTEVENVLCGTCQVLFSAPSALAAYDKGVSWATEHIEDSEFQFVGVEHVYSLNEEPADGVEVGGKFYESEDIWQRKSDLIPERDSIPAIMLEKNSNVPIGDLMTDEQKNVIRRVFGETNES